MELTQAGKYTASEWLLYSACRRLPPRGRSFYNLGTVSAFTPILAASDACVVTKSASAAAMSRRGPGARAVDGDVAGRRGPASGPMGVATRHRAYRTVGAAPSTSSNLAASAMARRIASVGRVSVSERRSMVTAQR